MTLMSAEPADGRLESRRFGAKDSNILFCVGVCAILMTCVVLLISDLRRIKSGRTGDFEHFFYAAAAVRNHADPYTAWTQGYIYPPLIAFLFQPLAMLTRSHAAAVMLAVNVSITFIALWLCADEFLRRFGVSRSNSIIVWIVFFSLLMNVDKVKGEWQMWQTDVFMLLLFVLALRWQSRLPLAAGIALGIAVNIKYLPLMFLPYFLIRRQWKISISMVIGTIAFALLPAITTGWTQNLRNWQTATAGLLQMTCWVNPSHANAAIEAAQIHDVTDCLSCSITSAFARSTKNLPHPSAGLILAALTAMVALLIAWLIYRRWQIPMLKTAASRPCAPSDAITACEWVMLLTAVLAFSPQTNTRHLFDALFLTSAASVLLIFARPSVNRLPLLIGCIVLVLGFDLPPGARVDGRELPATMSWLRIGGPCCCLLVAGFTLLWTGLAQSRALAVDGLNISRKSR
jgi:hypothetical protein